MLLTISCGREPTGLESARELAIGPVLLRFPAALQKVNATSGVIDVNRVRIVVRNPNAREALDTLVNFDGADSLKIPLKIPLDIWWPHEHEPFALSLAFISPQGDTVFRGGPVQLRVSEGSNAALGSLSVPVTYTGPGSDAAALRLSPRSLVVLSGDPFSFNGQAFAASGGVVPSAPIVWTTLDPDQAELPSRTDGSGIAIGIGGTARVVGQLLTGQADTVALVILPRPPTLALASGAGQSAAPGSALPGAIVVRVLESNGTGRAGVQVSFAPANGGSASPATTTTDASGTARTAWTLGSKAGEQQLKVIAAGATGSPLTVLASAEAPPKPPEDSLTKPDSTRTAARLLFTTQPTGGAAGVALSDVVVSAVDAAGDIVTTFADPISISLVGAPGSALSGDRTVKAVDGSATFSGLLISQLGAGLKLVASSGSLDDVSSAAFNVSAGPAAKIAIDGGNNQTGAVSTALATPLTAKVTDEFGNPVGLVTVRFAVASGGGSVSIASVQTSSAGLVSTTWTLGPTAGAQRVTASAEGLSGSPLEWTATAASATSTLRLAFIQGPTNTVAGRKFTPGLIVQALRADGTHDATFKGTVTLSLSSNPGGASISGATAEVGAGSATFNNTTLDRAGNGYQIVASAPGIESATSDLFNVGAAEAVAFQLVGGDGQDGIVSTVLASPLAVRVVDDLGNPVAGVSVAWRVTGGGGSVSAATSLTDATGVATILWTLGPTPGNNQTVEASVAGLTGSPIEFKAQAKKK